MLNQYAPYSLATLIFSVWSILTCPFWDCWGLYNLKRTAPYCALYLPCCWIDRCEEMCMCMILNIYNNILKCGAKYHGNLSIHNVSKIPMYLFRAMWKGEVKVEKHHLVVEIEIENVICCILNFSILALPPEATFPLMIPLLLSMTRSIDHW